MSGECKENTHFSESRPSSPHSLFPPFSCQESPSSSAYSCSQDSPCNSRATQAVETLCSSVGRQGLSFLTFGAVLISRKHPHHPPGAQVVATKGGRSGCYWKSISVLIDVKSVKEAREQWWKDGSVARSTCTRV